MNFLFTLKGYIFFRNNIAQGRKAKPAILQKHEISLFLYDQMLPSSVENKTNIHQGAALNSCCISPPSIGFFCSLIAGAVRAWLVTFPMEGFSGLS